MEALFPPTTNVTFTSDMSEEIEGMVSSLENNIVSGLILIVAILLFFLGAGTSYSSLSQFLRQCFFRS
ncbi:MAG: hypothetical protein CM1200mP14_08390 [Gammaproteobacteria bacterium]|nr:MAG: hypothetical protein CM1200mP14_08390 [Gammaproteobacteria bacterium]